MLYLSLREFMSEHEARNCAEEVGLGLFVVLKIKKLGGNTHCWAFLLLCQWFFLCVLVEVLKG